MSVPQGIDTSKANPARVYDCLLLGKDTYAADREFAARLEEVFPPPRPGHLPYLREMAVRGRLFLDRAVRYAAEHGCGQVLDLGSGLPVSGRVIPVPGGETIVLRDVHEAARQVIPGARVAYVDIDPVVVIHAKAFAAKAPGMSATLGDLTRPADVLAAVRDLPEDGRIDFARPAAVVLGSVLHFLPAQQAREVTAAYAGALTTGSYLVISCPRYDPDRDYPGLCERAGDAGMPAKYRNHDPAEVTSFFAGTRLVPPGVVPARGWRGDWEAAARPEGPSYVLAGVGEVTGAGNGEPVPRPRHG